MLEGWIFDGTTVLRGDVVLASDAIVGIRFRGRQCPPGDPARWGADISPCPGLSVAPGDSIGISIPGLARCEAEVTEVGAHDGMVICKGVGACPVEYPASP